MKKDLLILSGISVIAIAIGAGLFLYGTSTQTEKANMNGLTGLSVITRGTQAPISARKNFLISSKSDLQKLWTLLYGNSSTTPPLPNIDFSQNNIVAVFAGKKPTGGYEISVSGIHDTSKNRVVAVTIDMPGTSCAVTQTQTSPYEIVALPISSLPFTHKDIIMTNPCKGTKD